jgi:hypothetical protein
MTFQCRILCFKIRELNLQALARHRENSAATCKVLPYGSDLAASLSCQSYVKAECMVPQNCFDGKHPDAMIKVFSALHDNTQDPTHRVKMCNCLLEFFKVKSRIETYISDQQLYSTQGCIYHRIKVQVDGLDGEHISQICRCTGILRWRGGDRLNNWMRVKQSPGRCYGALNGRLPWQLQQQFGIMLLKEDGAFVEYWLAMALTTMPGNSGNLDPVSKFVPVRKVPAAVTLQVFRVGNIVGCVHVIPDIAASSKTGDGRNEQCIVNSHLDLVTWNVMYNWYRENCMLCAGRGNARRGFSTVTNRIAIPMQARAQ